MDIRHGFVFFLIIGGSLWLLLSGLIAVAQYEVTATAPNVSVNYSQNFTDNDPSMTDAIGIVQTFANLWGQMFGGLPGWMQAVIAAMFAALIIWVAATIWTGIGA